ncbi:MAG: hypothetical protein QXD03_00650 [Candidatus Anstonellales archaeon]
MIDIPQILRTKTLDEIIKISETVTDKNIKYLLLGSAFLKYKRYQYAYEFLKHVKDRYPRLFSYSAFYLGKYKEVIDNLKPNTDIFDLIVLTISYINVDDMNNAKEMLNRALKLDRKRTLELLKEYVANSPQTEYSRALLIFIDKLMKRI